jgi:stage II sporulation protein R
MDITLLVGLLIAIALSSLTGFAAESEQVRGQVLRLHILANSDSAEDQMLKYAIRDAILEECDDVFAGESPSAAKAMAAQRLGELEAIAAGVIARYGYTYEVSASLVNMYFATRGYDAVTAPPGRYDAVRITVGEAVGENWWCIMFPPMCIPAAATDAGNDVRDRLEEFSNPGYIPKFAVVELIESIRR